MDQRSDMLWPSRQYRRWLDTSNLPLQYEWKYEPVLRSNNTVSSRKSASILPSHLGQNTYHDYLRIVLQSDVSQNRQNLLKSTKKGKRKAKNLNLEEILSEYSQQRHLKLLPLKSMVRNPRLPLTVHKKKLPLSSHHYGNSMSPSNSLPYDLTSSVTVKVYKY